MKKKWMIRKRFKDFDPSWIVWFTGDLLGRRFKSWGEAMNYVSIRIGPAR